MAMKTPPRWYWVVPAPALLLIFLGERAFDIAAFTVAGLLVLAATTGIALTGSRKTEGADRKVWAALRNCFGGVWVALILYYLTTESGRGLIGVGADDPKALARFVTPMTVLWAVVMAASAIPLFMMSLSLFQQDKLGAGGDIQLEWHRVRETGMSGLTIALALGFLMVTCNVADQRNVRRDVSYFKTSSPGSSTVNAVKAQSEGIKVLLFFPAVNKVKDEVRDYFETLADRAGNVAIEEHDHRVVPELAKKYKVTKEGTVVIVQGEKHESVKLEADPEKAKKFRTQLRELDRKINAAVLKVIRERKVAYLSTGHGEINDPGSQMTKAQGPQTKEIRKTLTDLNYQVKDLSLVQGFASEVPDDADLVLILGPETGLSEGEIDAVDQYLARGGRVLLALDPKIQFDIGVLAGRLGVTFVPDPITTDNPREAVRLFRSPFDSRVIITNRFSSHASITTLTRGQQRNAILFIEAGSLDPGEFTQTPKPKRTDVIKSFPSMWRDTQQNLRFDKDTEKRSQYSLVAVVEGPAENPPEPEGDGGDEADEDKHEMRAMIIADRDIFRDVVQLQFPATKELFTDAVKWLGGEEYIQGEVVSEKDVYIEHTKAEDAFWFYITIIGAPLVVLAFGLWFSWWRRRVGTRSAS